MKILALMSLIFASFVAFSQEINQEFGKVSIEELEMTSYSEDTSAFAVKIFDIGKLEYELNMLGDEFQIILERTIRIKILTKNGLHLANQRIPLHTDGTLGESISKLEAYTYNLVDGKIEKTKLEKENIFEEQTSKYKTTIKVAMPAVKVGSVIEYHYIIISDNFGYVRSWVFQDYYPTKYTKYSVDIPQYFKFNINPIYLNEFNIKYNREYKERNYNAGTGSSAYIMKSINLNYDWYAENIPSFKTEKYITRDFDYIPQINFELKKVDYSGIGFGFFETWEDVDKKLRKSENFGNRLENINFIQLKSKEICQGKNTGYEKVEAIFNYVKANVKWNEDCWIFTEDQSKVTLRNGKGNIADINLLVIALIRSAGLYADPVILSTVENGKLNLGIPTIKNFDYVIAMAKISTDTIYLDASDKLHPVNFLPTRCLAGYGRLISDTHAKNIYLHPAKESTVSNYSCEISGDILTAKVSKKLSGYSAYNLRKLIELSGGIEEFANDFITAFSNIDIYDIEILNYDDLSKPIIMKYVVESRTDISVAGNTLFFPLLLSDQIVNERLTESPFPNQERKFPIYFGYPFSKKTIINFKYPENYTISELPESQRIFLENNDGSYNIMVQEIGGSIQVMSEFKINKDVFAPSEYNGLKKMYEMIISKQNEKIVFNKN